MSMKIISVLSSIAVPFFVIFVISYGILNNVKVYDAFCDGAKSGIELVFNILPFIFAMTVSIGLLRDSGLLDIFTDFLSIPLSHLGIPSEILRLYIIRPFSGSAALGILTDIFESEGVNSLVSDIASTMMGATETTFYTIALYYGSIGIKKTRYTILVAIICDITAMLVSVFICNLILK